MKTLPPTWTRLALTGLVAASLVGCAADLVTTPDTKTETKTETQAEAEQKQTTHTVDGTVHTQQINAADKNAWIYFNMASHSVVVPATPEDSTEWDLAFRRNKIKSNGGDSGKGGVSVAKLDSQGFDALTAAPAEGYVTDSSELTTAMPVDPDPYYAFLGDDAWYNYGAGHAVTPKENRVYVVKTTTGRYVKVQMLGYYSDDAVSGYPKFKYAEIEAPHQH